jgi:hypothetical protein
MFRRAAATLAATAALLAAGLLAAPLAQAADPVPPDGTAQPRLLDDLNVLPVQACGLDVNLPILSEVLGPDAAAPANCAQTDNDDPTG